MDDAQLLLLAGLVKEFRYDLTAGYADTVLGRVELTEGGHRIKVVTPGGRFIARCHVYSVSSFWTSPSDELAWAMKTDQQSDEPIRTLAICRRLDRLDAAEIALIREYLTSKLLPWAEVLSHTQ